jgi:hypothetical protein
MLGLEILKSSIDRIERGIEKNLTHKNQTLKRKSG